MDSMYRLKCGIVNRRKRYQESNKVYYHIYTKEEADMLKIKYVHWRDGKPGEYVITDDNWVCILRKIWRVNSRNNKARYVFPFITIEKWGKTKLFYEKYRGLYIMSGSSDPCNEIKIWRYSYLFSNKTRLQVLVIAYLQTGDKTRAFKAAFEKDFPEIFEKPWKLRKLRALIFSSRKVSMLIKKEIKEQLASHGITPGTYLDKVNKLWDVAVNGKKVDDMMKVLSKFEQLQGVVEETVFNPQLGMSMPEQLGEGNDHEFNKAMEIMDASKQHASKGLTDDRDVLSGDIEDEDAI